VKHSTESGPVLVLGGYGTFGRLITRALATAGLQVIINGRQPAKARALQQRITEEDPAAKISVACFDVQQQLSAALERLQPALVIHTCGPFQSQDTAVARTIVTAGSHYLDLADSREYVAQMNDLDGLARQHQVTAITGASTVPALSSAVLTWLQETHQIQRFNSVRMGISPGQQAPRGLATTQAVLSYLGQAMKPWPGDCKKRFGWMDLYRQAYPTIGGRLMGNCEAPDLDLLGQHFGIEQLQFSAGMDSKLLHLLMWLTAGLIRLGLPLNLNRRAAGLLKISHWFDVLGSADGGMHIAIEATDVREQPVRLTWFIEALAGCGPHIPATPAVLMTRKILQGEVPNGVSACVNWLTLDEYLSALSDLQIKTSVITED